MKTQKSAKKKTKNIEKHTLRNPLNNAMPNYAAYRFSGAEKAVVSLIAFVLGGLASQVFYGGLFMSEDGSATLLTNLSNAFFFVIVGLIAIKFLGPLYQQQCLDKQRNTLQKQFLSLLDSLSASFASGSNVRRSFENAYSDLVMQYKEDDFIVREAREIISGTEQNIGIEVMLKDFGERSGNDHIISFADVFETCYRKGGNMQSVILRTNDAIRERILISDEIQTKLTSNKMQLNVMSLMPIGIVAMLKMMNPSFATAFASPVGILANTVAVAIFAGAYKYGQKVIAIGG